MQGECFCMTFINKMKHSITSHSSKFIIMGDNQNGLSLLSQSLQMLRYSHHIFEIKAAGRFVQKQNRRIYPI